MALQETGPRSLEEVKQDHYGGSKGFAVAFLAVGVALLLLLGWLVS